MSRPIAGLPIRLHRWITARSAERPIAAPPAIRRLAPKRPRRGYTGCGREGDPAGEGRQVIAVQEEPRDGIPSGPPPASGAPTTPGSAPGPAAASPAGGAPAEPGPLAFSTRRRAYFAMMGACLLLIVLSWTLIWRFSILAAVIMSAVALFIPPLAAIVANSGQANRQLPPWPRSPRWPGSSSSTRSTCSTTCLQSARLLRHHGRHRHPEPGTGGGLRRLWGRIGFVNPPISTTAMSGMPAAQSGGRGFDSIYLPSGRRHARRRRHRTADRRARRSRVHRRQSPRLGRRAGCGVAVIAVGIASTSAWARRTAERTRDLLMAEPEEGVTVHDRDQAAA
jgi:hypothetical protein